MSPDGKIRAVEVAYNLYNEKGDHRWHVVVRDGRTGKVNDDLPGLFLYGVADLGPRSKSLCCLKADGRGVPTIAEGQMLERRGGAWEVAWRHPKVSWQLVPIDWPIDRDSIASLGPDAHQVLRSGDVDRDGDAEVFAVVDESSLIALGREPTGRVVEKFRFKGPPGSRVTIASFDPARRACLIDVDADEGPIRLSGCTAVAKAKLPRADFAPLPARPMAVVADVDGDGANEIIAQDSLSRTRIARLTPSTTEPKEVLRIPGGGLWLGTRWPGYPYVKFPVWTGDLDGDGRRELLLTDAGDEVVSTLTCRDSSGKQLWKQSLADTPARSIVWITPGHFVRHNRVDLFVVVQNGGLGESFVLDGSTGAIIWRRAELKTDKGAPFNVGSQQPMLAAGDVDGDGLDDILGETDPYLLVLRGRDGTPLVPPRMMIGDIFKGFVVYGEAASGNWDGSGRPSIFTNTPIGGFGLVGGDLKLKWSVHQPSTARNCVGSIGRLRKDGPWFFGTIAGTEFQLYDMRDGKQAAAGNVGVDPGAYSSVYCADVDGDGQDDFLAVAGERIVCISLDKDLRPSVKWSATAPGAASPLTIADADNDGLLDLLYTGGDGCIHILSAH